MSFTSLKGYSIIPYNVKLESTDQQERIWACAAISNLIQNDPSTRRLLQGKNIVGLLITRLSDEVEEVVVEAAGALRCVILSKKLILESKYRSEICALMEGLKFVRKCSTRAYSSLSNPSYRRFPPY